MSFPEFKKLESVEPEISDHVGARLRARRRALDLTLDQVAGRAGCSESMLCKVETGKVNPSITLLRRIAGALSLNMAALFDTDFPADVVQRAGQRPRMSESTLRKGEGITLERLIPPGPNVVLQADIHIISVGGASDGMIAHNGEEVGYILEGQVELVVEGRSWTLEAGDSFYFKSDRPHGYRNLGTSPARILWVNTPPSF